MIELENISIAYYRADGREHTCCRKMTEKTCVLHAKDYTVKFIIFSVSEANDDWGHADYQIEFYLNTDLEKPLVKSHRRKYLKMDLEVFADHMDEHISRFLKKGKVKESFKIGVYGTRFQARLGNGWRYKDEFGVYQYFFGLEFMVNVSPKWTEMVFIGGDSEVNVKDMQEFRKSLYAALSEDF